MQLKTILNRVQKQPGFVYGKAEFVQREKGPEVLEVQLEPDTRTQPVCSGCGKKGPGYDKLSQRRFDTFRTSSLNKAIASRMTSTTPSSRIFTARC
jgi:hypothetical protein